MWLVDNFKSKNGYLFRAAVRNDESAIQILISDVLQEYGLTLDKANTDQDLYDIEDFYRDGYFGIIEDQKGYIVGTFALKSKSNSELELRKMYLKKEHRAKGLGKYIVSKCIKLASDKNFKHISLETASVLKEAIGLYVSMGFVTSDQESEAQRCDRTYIFNL